MRHLDFSDLICSACDYDKNRGFKQKPKEKEKKADREERERDG